MSKTTAQKDAHAVKDGIGQKDVYVTAVGDTTKAYFGNALHHLDGHVECARYMGTVTPENVSANVPIEVGWKGGQVPGNRIVTTLILGMFALFRSLIGSNR